MDPLEIKNVAIIGVGLIGGSLGMALKDVGAAEKVIGVSRDDQHLRLAIEKKAIDEGTADPASAVMHADLVVLATPIDAILPLLKKIIPYLRPGTIVTDVASTKQSIVQAAEKLMPPGTYFVGSHPMAGSERSGIEAAHHFLFDNAVWVFTLTPQTHLPALDALKAFLGKLDIRPLVLSPEIHDTVVAGISHLPYIIACALVKTLADEKEAQDEMVTLASSGFRDTTRVAASLAGWGQSICLTNQKALLAEISKFKKALLDIEKLIQKGNADDLLNGFSAIQRFRGKMF